jgi:L-histidine N-alpha-methyltransferase
MPNQATEPRVRIDVLMDESDRRAALYDATFWTLRATPKELPAVWLYDETGSRLFEQITRLPEYYLTAAEREILVQRAAEIAELTQPQTLVELGAGTSEKTLLLLDALTAADTLERFVPLDASEEVLLASAHTIADRYPAIAVHAIVGDFERHRAALPAGDNRLVAFLGSTIGNLYPDRRRDLFAAVATAIGPTDSFLLGIDLVKDPDVIEAAYHDPGGVTEQFVRNSLTVVNRDLRANFDQQTFAFEPRWVTAEQWMDIGFRSLEAQRVTIDELEIELDLGANERLRIEISAKFTRAGIEQELADAGLRSRRWWTDEREQFALVLATTA